MQMTRLATWADQTPAKTFVKIELLSDLTLAAGCFLVLMDRHDTIWLALLLGVGGLVQLASCGLQISRLHSMAQTPTEEAEDEALGWFLWLGYGRHRSPLLLWGAITFLAAAGCLLAAMAGDLLNVGIAVVLLLGFGSSFANTILIRRRLQAQRAVVGLYTV